MDLYTTVLEMASLKVPPNYTQDGQSLVKTLTTGYSTDQRYLLVVEAFLQGRLILFVVKILSK